MFLATNYIMVWLYNYKIQWLLIFSSRLNHIVHTNSNLQEIEIFLTLPTFYRYSRYSAYGSPLSPYYNNVGPALTSNMGGIQPPTQQQQSYEATSDYVDSTTPITYESKQTGGFLDPDFMSGELYLQIYWTRMTNTLPRSKCFAPIPIIANASIAL